jgi:hypothetical protein
VSRIKGLTNANYREKKAAFARILKVCFDIADDHGESVDAKLKKAGQ